MIYFDRIEVVNMLVPTAGNTLRTTLPITPTSPKRDWETGRCN